MSPDTVERIAKLLALQCNVIQRILTCEALHDVGEVLTLTQYSGLRFVALHPGACIRDMAMGLQVSHPAAVKLAERLQERGLILRSQAEKDQRRVCLYTTEEGQRLYRRVRYRLQTLIERVLSTLGDKGVQDLEMLLKAFLSAALSSQEQIARVCLYCGVEHESSCAVGQLEEALAGKPRDMY